MEAVFPRERVQYREERWSAPRRSAAGRSASGRSAAGRLCARRIQLEEDIEQSVRRRMFDSGLIKDHCIYLVRFAESCFLGLDLLEHLAQEFPDIVACEVKELADTLYREHYVVPVMKFVNMLSKTTVLYRYSRDERRVKPKLAQERLSSLELVRYIIEKAAIASPHIAGNKLLEILDIRARDMIQHGDDVITDDVITEERAVKNRCYRQCQRMLVHGFLVPAEAAVLTRNECYQQFKAECSYSLCDTIQKQEHTKQEEDNSRTLNRQRSNAVSWTMEFKTQETDGRYRLDSQISDVEVVENTPDILSYTPPPPPNSQEKIKRRARKISGMLGFGNNEAEALRESLTRENLTRENSRCLCNGLENSFICYCSIAH